ncbi:MAG: hypothetical protein Q8R17_01030 [bacterium]|nr:hypothetical protein [bacterium]
MTGRTTALLILAVLIGLAVIVFCIQNRTKIAGWFTGGSWKTALWWVCGVTILALAVWGGISIYSHWDKVKVWPYWLYVFIGVPIVIAITLWSRSGRGASGTAGAKPSDKFKKGLETGMAFAKLGALLAFTAVLGIFIVGPRYFWGEPSVVQVQQPAAQRQAQTQISSRSFTTTAQPGDPQDPRAPWSASVVVNGRRFSADVQGANIAVPMAVLADGVVHIIAPGFRPHIGTPQEIRFLSLTNFPLQISGTIE